jgi:LTXXQ motif family protein
LIDQLISGRSSMKRLTLPVAMLLATVSTSSWAQSPADHEAHHPDQKSAPAATQLQPPPGQTGMMEQGMIGDRSGMMGGGMMNMMRNMPMMNMGGMATIDHVEGRIAFLRTELKITDAQMPAWNAFADALRANTNSLGEVRASMMPQPSAAPQNLVDRLTLQEKWLAARLEGTRAIKSALASLVGTLSDEQKKTADELLAPHVGMMGMMAGMQPGQMGFDRMPPGMMTQGQGR